MVNDLVFQHEAYLVNTPVLSPKPPNASRKPHPSPLIALCSLTPERRVPQCASSNAQHRHLHSIYHTLTCLSIPELYPNPGNETIPNPLPQKPQYRPHHSRNSSLEALSHDSNPYLSQTHRPRNYKKPQKAKHELPTTPGQKKSKKAQQPKRRRAKTPPAEDAAATAAGCRRAAMSSTNVATPPAPPPPPPALAAVQTQTLAMMTRSNNNPQGATHGRAFCALRPPSLWRCPVSGRVCREASAIASQVGERLRMIATNAT